jgi:hypothetical protein
MMYVKLIEDEFGDLPLAACRCSGAEAQKENKTVK